MLKKPYNNSQKTCSEALRSEKMRKVADKTADTRLCKILDNDELGK